MRIISGIYVMLFLVPAACITIIVMSVFDAFNSLAYFNFIEKSKGVDQAMVKQIPHYYFYNPLLKNLIRAAAIFLNPIIAIIPNIHRNLMDMKL